MKNYFALGVLSLAFVVLGTGCGGKKNNTTPAATAPGTLRLANATQTASLTMNAVGISDTTVTFSSSAVAPGAVSDYQTAAAQSYTMGVGATDGSLTAATQAVSVGSSLNSTLIAYARSGAINTYVLTDNQTTPASGFSLISVANVAGDAGTLDVYLVSPSASLNGVAPVFSGVGSRTTSTAKAMTSGTYDIVVTASGKPNDVRLSMPSVAFASTDIVTVALTSTQGGALVDGALIKQGGAMQLKPNTLARARVAGAFPSNGSNNSTVSVVIGSSSLGALTAPSLTAYKLIPGGQSIYTVSVDGIAVANLPAATFVNGGDYTILVSGTPAVPDVKVITDNNQPSISGYANIRTVNAAVAGGVTLYDNYVPVNIDVPVDTASEYVPTTALSTSVVEITSPVSAFPTYNQSNVNIVGSGVYTFFILGSSDKPIISLSKDR